MTSNGNEVKDIREVTPGEEAMLDCLGMYRVRLEQLQKDWHVRTGAKLPIEEILGVVISRGDAAIRHYWDASDKQKEDREALSLLKSAGVKSKAELIALLREKGIA